MLLIMLIIFMPISFAKEVSIPELFIINKESISTSSDNEVYYYVGSKLIASSNGEIKYNYQDRLGSDFGSKNLPFGQPILTEDRFSFTGKELDQELYYFGARYYDPSLGRFTSVDPVVENHPYIYVNNNPLNLIDPTGMDDNGLRQNYEIDEKSLDDFVSNYFPGKITEKNRQKLRESIFKAFEEGMEDAQKDLISQLTQEEIERLGFSEGLPKIILHFTHNMGTTKKGTGNFAHAGIWTQKSDEELVYHVRISSDIIPPMFIKGDVFRHKGDFPIERKDARIIKKATTLAVKVIYGREPSLSFWERQRYGWQIGYSGVKSSQSKWFADLTALFNKIHN